MRANAGDELNQFGLSDIDVDLPHVERNPAET
jgi:hypothetical protein